MRRLPLRIALLFAVLAAALFGAPPNALADEDWSRWQRADSGSTATVDHGPWAAFLSAYLVFDPELKLNRMAYGSVTGEDKARLADYIAELAALPVETYNRNEQLAYWLDLYNALTVELVLDHYPVPSIRDIDISPGLFDDGPWGAKLVAVEGVSLSLDDIEHRILRPIWRDPLIHYGVNCASVGCPNLAAVPYTGANVASLLAEGARAYVNSPRGAGLEGDRLIVSGLYDWYEEDFGGSEENVIAHLEAYAAPGLKTILDRFPAIDGYRYDWSLNDAPAAR